MKLRKTLCLVLSLVLLIALAIPAFAVNDSITVTGAKPGETYSLYKLFDLKVDSETTPTKYSYTINSDWEAFFTGSGAGAAYITVESGYVTAVSDAAALAKAAAAWTGKPGATQTKACAEGATSVEFTGLADGYWLITSTLGSIAMIETTPDASQVTIAEKNPVDTLEKQVKEDSTGTYGNSNDTQIGDLVEFKSTLTLQPGTTNVVVHDKMTDGLTYTAGSVTIEGLTKGTQYTVNESPADGDTFDITFDPTYISGITTATVLTITYTATVNENAEVADPETNSSHVDFGDNQHSTPSTTETKTHSFNVFKHATSSTDNLAGAVFQLKKAGAVVNLIKIDDTHYRVAKTGETGTVDRFTTVASGDIVISGVDSDDDYTLLEVTAPEGYNKLAAEVPVTVNADNSTRADVENKTGTELPSTGGIGTTIFYIVGALLVVGAGVVLFTRKRMKGEQ